MQPCGRSFLRLTYPFSRRPELRELYSKGRALDVAHWLEDLDTFAGACVAPRVSPRQLGLSRLSSPETGRLGSAWLLMGLTLEPY